MPRPKKSSGGENITTTDTSKAASPSSRTTISANTTTTTATTSRKLKSPNKIKSFSHPSESISKVLRTNTSSISIPNPYQNESNITSNIDSQSSSSDIPTALILDTGGWSIKHGKVYPQNNKNKNNNTQGHYNPSDSINYRTQEPKISPNFTAKPKHQLATLYSNQIHSIHNKSQLEITHPFERGFNTNLASQFQIWGYILDVEEHLNCVHSFSSGGVKTFFPNFSTTTTSTTTTDKSLSKLQQMQQQQKQQRQQQTVSSEYTHSYAVVLLLQPFTPRCILQNEDEVWFRDFGFSKVCRILGSSCTSFRFLRQIQLQQQQQHQQQMEGETGNSINLDKELWNWQDDETKCCCVIDSGFSFTHIVPTVNCLAIEKAIRRINIGGKVLTNLLKQVLSYRQWNMMDEFFLVNDVKEKTCFVNLHFTKDIHDSKYVPLGLRWFDREYVLPNYVDTFSGSVRLPLGLLRKQQQQQKQLEKAEEERKKEIEKECNNKRQKRNVDLMTLDHESQTQEILNSNTTPKIKSVDSEHDHSNINKEHDSQEEGDNNKDDDDDKNDDNDDSEIEDDEEMETIEQKRQRILQQRQDEKRRQELEELERQVLTLSVERFTIPEVFFRPSDLDLPTSSSSSSSSKNQQQYQQSFSSRPLGIAEAIVQSIESCDAIYRAAMYHNIVLTGGNANFSNFRQRLEEELRSIAPCQYKIRVFVPDDPVTYAWKGACDMMKEGHVFVTKSCCMDRMEYEKWKNDVNSSNRGGVDIWSSLANSNLPDGFILV